MIKFLDLRAQYHSIKEDVDSAVSGVIESSNFVLGDNLANFEQEFAQYCGAKHCAGVNSGTSALHLALAAKGIGRGDEVITVPNTFVSTCAAILYTGATPKLVDIDDESYNMDPGKLEKAITPRTKAIIPVHLYGQPADMKIIGEIAKKHDVQVIEDACQAHGAEHHGKKMPFSDTGCFSFYPGKNLGSYGEGGAIVSNDHAFIEKVKAYRHHGQIKKNLHKYVGYNYRLEELQASILRVKLRHLDKWNEMRRANATVYDKLLEGAGVRIPSEISGNKHIYHLYVVRSKNRDGLSERLNSKEIQTGIHYPIPIHLQEAYRILGYKEGDFPVSERFAKEIVSIPMYPELKEAEIKKVVDEILDF